MGRGGRAVIKLTGAFGNLGKKAHETGADMDELRAKVLAVEVEMDSLIARGDEIRKGRVADALQFAQDLARSARYDVDALNTAMGASNDKWNQEQTHAEAFASVLHTILDIQTALAEGYQQRPAYQGNAGAQNKQYVEQTASAFQSMIDQLRRAGGPNSALAAIVNNILTELKGGIITPDEAIQVLRGMLSGYESGVLRDIGQGATQEIRNLAAALERFIASGSLTGFR